MIEQARAGGLDVIVAYSNSRLTRRPREFEDLIDLPGVRIVTVVSGEDNLATADGRMVARIKASIDAGEAERVSERSRRAKAQAAQQGRWRGGGRPFGYEADGLTVREAEARVVREGTRAVLAGRTLSALAREWNEAGLTSTRGNRWSVPQVRSVLLRPRNAGLVHRGLLGSEEMEIIGPAQWPAIVDPDAWQALYALVTSPDRYGRGQSFERRWLGSGLYICGMDGCGATLRGQARQQRGSYRCSVSGHLTVEAYQTDRAVLQALADLVRDPRVVAAMTAPDPDLAALRERRQALTARLEGFEGDYLAGRITGTQFQRFTAAVSEDLDGVEERIAASARRSASSPVLVAADPGQALLDAPLDVQRALLRTLLRVEIARAKGRGFRWNAERLRITRATASGAGAAA
jgi:hypothetical protein